jgi:hypothetical protein
VALDAGAGFDYAYGQYPLPSDRPRPSR